MKDTPNRCGSFGRVRRRPVGLGAVAGRWGGRESMVVVGRRRTGRRL